MATPEPTIQGLSNQIVELATQQNRLSAAVDRRFDKLSSDFDSMSANVNKLSSDFDNMSANINKLSTDVRKVSTKVDSLTDYLERSNEKFDTYPKATQWVVQLAFTLIASATITVILSTVLTK
jgi:outer membrane murein-binding lipoprotein Lpp